MIVAPVHQQNMAECLEGQGKEGWTNKEGKSGVDLAGRGTEGRLQKVDYHLRWNGPRSVLTGRYHLSNWR